MESQRSPERKALPPHMTTPSRKRSLQQDDARLALLESSPFSPEQPSLWGTPTSVDASPSSAYASSPGSSISSPVRQAAQAFESLMRSPTSDRPELKRRKTAPPALVPTHLALSPKKSPEKRISAKEGIEVWPADVEEAFYQGALLTSFFFNAERVCSTSHCTQAGSKEDIGQWQTLRSQRAHCRLHLSHHEESQDAQASL
jgi:hypothetical protein